MRACVLKLALCLSQGGHWEAVVGITGMARAFRSDVTLWNVHKAYKGPGGWAHAAHACVLGGRWATWGGRAFWWARRRHLRRRH